MAGKRPDQHNIDPREAGATDYKNLPQMGHGGSNLDDTVELDRQRLAVDRAEDPIPGQSRGIPVPGKHPAPSQHANRGMQADAAGETDEVRREAEGTEDPRERGVGA